MFDYIVDHAQKHVWCTPRQDMQSIVQPARLTPLGGVWNTVSVQWRTITLPLPTVKFHVYQIGQLNPLLMGLLSKSNTWETFSDTMNQEKLIVDIYTTTGVQMPRYACWYMVTLDKNLIVAIQEQATVPINLDTDPIFIRVYKNAYYNSAASNAVNDFIQTAGQTCLNQASILTLQNAYQSLQAQMAAATIPTGEVYAFVNGFRVSGIDLFTAQVGDCVEYIYDSSIYEVVEFSISDLQVFTSTLDSKLKYLLHYSAVGDGEINYQDDIDGFLYLPGQNNRWQGVYYHRNAVDAMRMVTHKDYAIPSTYVAAYAQQQAAWQDPTKLVLRLHVRKSGWNRPLVFENNRIEELYKLPDAEIVQAMIGVNAVVPNWTAPTLEASPYTKIMRATLPQITNLLVQQAYGYNAIAKIIGDTPSFSRIESGQTVADVPYGLQDNCTGFEYDVNGNLIGFFQHPFGSVYPCSTSFAAKVELISGQGGNLLDETYGQVVVSLVPGANYRYYTCPINSVTGLPTYVWQDVTGSSQYTVQDSTVTWLTDPTKVYTLVRGDQKFLAYEIAIPADAGVLEFTLMQQAVRNQAIETIEMEIPMGELYVWLNNNALVEGIDYIVNFPQIVITNVKYLVDGGVSDQDIAVRFTGFCNADLTRQAANDVGFIKYGRLSDNNRYDIRDDMVLSMVVGGRFYDRSELTFQEDSGAVIPDAATNGEPYQIRDIIVPLKSIVAADTYALRAQSQVIDEAVANYLTSKLAETDPDTPSVIPAPWAVYSPFFARIMNDLISGVFAPSFLTAQYSDQDVLNATTSYEWLLAFDQTQDAIAADPDFMIVLPHSLPNVVTVSIYIYKFLSRVVALYLHNKVNLSHFINIAQIA